jgi:hypothetical protein
VRAALPAWSLANSCACSSTAAPIYWQSISKRSRRSSCMTCRMTPP